MIYVFTRRRLEFKSGTRLPDELKHFLQKRRQKLFEGLLTSFSENSLNLSNKNFPAQQLLINCQISVSGAIFEQGTDEVQSAFKFAMLNHNLNVTGRRFELQAFVDLISTADAFKLSRLSEYTSFNVNNFRTEKSFFSLKA